MRLFQEFLSCYNLMHAIQLYKSKAFHVRTYQYNWLFTHDIQQYTHVISKFAFLSTTFLLGKVPSVNRHKRCTLLNRDISIVSMWMWLNTDDFSSTWHYLIVKVQWCNVAYLRALKIFMDTLLWKIMMQSTEKRNSCKCRTNQILSDKRVILHIHILTHSLKYLRGIPVWRDLRS